MSENQFVYCEIITGVPHCKCMWHLIHLLPLCIHKQLQLRYQELHIYQLKLAHIRRTEQNFPVDPIELRQIKQDHNGSFRQNLCGNGTGTGTRMGLCILCQTFTLQLMWELKWVLYFGIVLVPVPIQVPVPRKFCLNEP